MGDDIPGRSLHHIAFSADAVAIEAGKPCLRHHHAALGTEAHPAKTLFVVTVAATPFDQPAAKIELRRIISLRCGKQQIDTRFLVVARDLRGAIGINLADCILRVGKLGLGSFLEPGEGEVDARLARRLHHQHLAVIELCHGVAAFRRLFHQFFCLGGVFFGIGALKQKCRIAELRFDNSVIGRFLVPLRRQFLIGGDAEAACINLCDECLRCRVALFGLRLGQIEGGQIKPALKCPESLVSRLVAKTARIDARNRFRGCRLGQHDRLVGLPVLMIALRATLLAVHRFARCQNRQDRQRE